MDQVSNHRLIVVYVKDSLLVSKGFYTYPCSSALNISFALGGHSFAIELDDFNLGMTDAGSEYASSTASHVFSLIHSFGSGTVLVVYCHWVTDSLRI